MVLTALAISTSSGIVIAGILPDTAVPKDIAADLPMAVNSTAHGESDYHNDPWTFLLFSFIMSFGSVSAVLGAFALKYGKKRTWVWSVPMILAGIGTWSFWILFKVILRAKYPHDTLFGIVHWAAAPLLLPLMALLGAGLGSVAALAIFLNTIVRT